VGGGVGVPVLGSTVLLVPIPDVALLVPPEHAAMAAATAMVETFTKPLLIWFFIVTGLPPEILKIASLIGWVAD
jgi:hypothetical protein